VNALAFAGMVLLVLAVGAWVYHVMRFPDEVDEGRVRSDAPRFYRPDEGTRAELERYRREVDE